MVIEKTKLEFSEKDLLLLIADHYRLDPKKSSIRISHYDGDQRELQAKFKQKQQQMQLKKDTELG